MKELRCKGCIGRDAINKSLSKNVDEKRVEIGLQAKEIARLKKQLENRVAVRRNQNAA